jgi:hypothetical protein
MSSSDKKLPLLPGYITVSLAAERLHVTRQTVHQMVRSEKLRGWRIASASDPDPVVVDEKQVAAMTPRQDPVVISIPVPS